MKNGKNRKNMLFFPSCAPTRNRNIAYVPQETKWKKYIIELETFRQCHVRSFVRCCVALEFDISQTNISHNHATLYFWLAQCCKDVYMYVCVIGD